MEKLRENSNFVVKPSSGVFLVVALLFTAVFVYSFLYDAKPQEKPKVEITFLLLVPAVFFFWKAFAAKPVIITINKNGIFHYGKLVSNWYNFLKAEVTQESKILSISDNFILLVHFRSATGKVETEKIPLTNTQDKSEEEIIAAIKFFSLHSNRTS